MAGKLRKKQTFVPVALVALALVAGAMPSGQAAAQNQTTDVCQRFEETGKMVCGTFLDYWNANGKLAQQGFPLSEQMQERSDTDGKTYTVQYFERAVFEAHPENKPPYNVLLQLLGSMRLKETYPKGVKELPDDAKAEAGMTFPETGKTVKGAFLDYWKKNGGVAQQGFPITNLVREKSALDGKEYTMQYFERAVFELHPENQPPFNVLLSQLGRLRYQMKHAAGTGTPLVGQWGGEHMVVTLSDTGGYIEFACAHVNIKDPVTVVNGKFEVNGEYVRESGVQMEPDMMPPPEPAVIKGTVDGATLTLTIDVSGGRQMEIGPFIATKGKEAFLRKCL